MAIVKADSPKMTGLSFGEALERMKDGYKCARLGWNGRGMFVFYVPKSIGPRIGSFSNKVVTPFSTHIPKHIETIELDAYLVMWTAQETVQVGWLASQSDMLAQDWQVVQ